MLLSNKEQAVCRSLTYKGHVFSLTGEEEKMQSTEKSDQSQGLFTYSYMTEMLVKLKGCFDQVLTLKETAELSHPESCLLIRHDIDFSIELALKVAKIESQIGLRSTFFVRFDAKYYNPFFIPHLEMLHEIKSMGHELGLHYSVYPGSTGLDPTEHVMTQKNTLEHLLNAPVESGAPHEPSRTIQNSKNPLADLFKVDAYSDQLMSQFKYISDSGGRWREGNPMNWLEEKNLYVLIHPFWWFNTSPCENY